MSEGDARFFSRRSTLAAAAVALAATSASVGALLASNQSTPPVQASNPEWLFVPTPMPVVERMLALAAVTKDDLVLDLGSGDGRIPIMAAKTYGARARGVDIDPLRIKESNANLKRMGVEDLVTFEEGDVFKVPIADATVVTLYLFPHVVLRLGERLRAELRPGTRIVSHRFMFDDWRPHKREEVDGVEIFLWVV